MKIRYLLYVLIPLCCLTSLKAEELGSTTQAVIYYQLPFGGSGEQKSGFGLRIEQAPRWAESIHYATPKTPSPALDLQVDMNGVVGLQLHGRDYMQYFVAAIDDEEGTTTEDDEAATPSSPPPEDEKRLLEFSDVVNQTTVGIATGVIIGIIALTGAGG